MSATQLGLAERRPAIDPEGRAFIEVQFPVSKLSKESYKERKAVAGQTLTALGKWWGRKPLVLVRAIILGLLLPATDDPEKDREIFLALMTMDDDGLARRIDGAIPAGAVYERVSPVDRVAAFEVVKDKPKWRRGLAQAERERLQRRAFRAMSYDARLGVCMRPEEIDGPSADAWAAINDHLGTSAASLPELVRELGERRFGHAPKVGDAFSGGGSIPFEAGRIGCDAYASDLNPVAGLLTWGALNIVGGGEAAVAQVQSAQKRVFDTVKRQFDDWGIERNEQGWIADAYLYCVDVLDPVTGWRVPMAPSWVIASKTNVIARLVPVPDEKRFAIEIVEGVSAAELEQAANEGTADDGLRCPVDEAGNWLPINQRRTTSLDQIRGSAGLRRWTNDDVVPRIDDIYGERLYCIRWMDPATGKRHYRAPDQHDLERESQVRTLLVERFGEWQRNGHIPSRLIESGDKTDEPIRTRGWTHWHHLFNPRQLLLAGSLSEAMQEEAVFSQKCLLLMLGRLANWSSRLTTWQIDQGGGIGGGKQSFYNQAINTLVTYSARPTATAKSAFVVKLSTGLISGKSSVSVNDARSLDIGSDIWVTDPGYGDVVLYDELSEFFLAWYEKRLPELFPGWYADSKRALNVKGEGETFRLALAECYQNLANHMPANGFQVVMFTHQDPEVWADVGLTLWAAGLRVSVAWTVSTETPTTGIKGGGNYVQGTVILVLRKRTDDRRGDLSDLYPDIQTEVKRQIEEMLRLDDQEEPNFGDADYQLAAYAAALRVLTSYASIDEIDVRQELRRVRKKGETSPLARLIGQAVRIASDYLVPDGLDRAIWKRLTPEERLYLKAIETEASGEAREGVYQELARGYGAGPHKELYASRTANKVRFKTPTELAARDLGRVGEPGFRGSPLRQVLYAVYETGRHPDRDPRDARRTLRADLPDYWQQRLAMAETLRFLIKRAEALPHWRADVESMRLLQTSLEHDAV
jgi:adenine-specific DNA methylase